MLHAVDKIGECSIQNSQIKNYKEKLKRYVHGKFF